MNGSLKWECKIGESCGAAFNMAATAFVASTCELVTRRFLIGAGLSVETHPTVPGTTERPDFAAKNEQGAIKAYVEVTTTNPSAELVGQMNRENLIYEAIDGANIPNGGILGYHLVKAGSDSPPLVPLVSSVEEWARDNLEAARQGEVVRMFDAGQWRIALELYACTPTPTETAARSAGRAIGIRSLRGGIITPEKDIRNALKKKAGRYGDLNAPYLIVVCDAKENIINRNAVQSANNRSRVRRRIFAIHRRDHAPEVRPQRPLARLRRRRMNKHVTGVLLLPRTSIWDLRDERHEPIVAVNPWATRPLPVELKSITRYEADGASWVLHEGERFANVLNLPDPWPPEEP